MGNDIRPQLIWATRRAQESFPYFLKWIWTVDEAEENPRLRVKRFPFDEPYVQLLAAQLQREKLLYIPKSRRMMLSWLNAAKLVWGTLTPGYHGFIQTKKERDADFLVRERCYFIWEHLPKWLRFISTQGHIDAHYKKCEFIVPHRGHGTSKIWGVPQGADQFRGFTPSDVFLDEVAFWDQFEESITSILPLREKGCGITAVSTASPGEFGDIVQSPVDGEIIQLARGIQKWQLQYGGRVLQVHYTADPYKDPARLGKEWYEETIKDYPGGPTGPKWRQEMEIDFSAYLGERIFPQYTDQYPQVVPDFEIPEDWPRWRAGDWGNRNATAFLWLTWDPKRDIYYVYREFYQPSESIESTKEIIAYKSGDEEYLATWVDPATDRHDSDELRSVFYLLNHGENALGAWKAERARAGLELINTWLHQNRIRFFESVINTRKEALKYRYEDWEPASAQKHNKKETPLKKDDHAMNALKYFANGVRHREHRSASKRVQKRPAEPGSFAWFMQQKDLERKTNTRLIRKCL